jgi:TonB family protein
MIAALLSPRVVAAQETPPTPRGVAVPPKVRGEPSFRYPDQALKERFFETVTVVVVIEIDTSGKVRKAAVESRQGHGFDDVALATAERLTFEPAQRDGAPVAARFKFRCVFRPPPARLVGRVADRVTDAPLAGVEVMVRAADGDHAVKSAGDGTWILEDAPRGPVHVVASAKGLDPESADAELTPGDETRVVLRLQQTKEPAAPAEGPRQPTVNIDVKGERPEREVTKRRISHDELPLIPGTNGDALRSIQSLPGVARPPPFSGQLIVRGSAAQDTNLFVDGTPVPLLYHFGGLSSVMPAELLDKIDFVPSNYSSLYGRGMGGIVDIGIRGARDDGIHGMTQVDAIDARILAEGPIANTGIRFLVAGRRSWFDLWLGPVLKATGTEVTTAPRYYDYQVMLERDFGSRQSLRLFFFGSDDAIDILNPAPGSGGIASGFGGVAPGASGVPSAAGNPTVAGDLNFHQSFWRLQARYQNKFTDDTRLSIVAAVGQDIVDASIGSRLGNHTQEIPVTGRIELTQKVVRGVDANVGVDIAYIPYHLDVRRLPLRRPGIPGGGPLDMPLESVDSGSRFLPGMYTEWELTPFPGTRIVPGIRVDEASTTKTWDVSPRLSLRQDLTSGFPRTTLKAGLGLYAQPPLAIETDPTFGQRGLVSNRAVHSDVGVEQDLTRSLDVSVDGFYKHMDNLVTPGASNQGSGFAYGVEWFLRYKSDGRFFGWLSYTFSRSERRDIATDPLTLFSNDQTHIFTVLGSYEIGWGFRLGARFRLASGNPFTPSTQGAFDAASSTYQAAPANPPYGARLPLFHALDLRVDRVWTFPRWKLTWYLDIQNVYSYQAVEGVTYNYDFTQSSYVRGLPIIPSVGLRGEL